jgi:hypothetical protein
MRTNVGAGKKTQFGKKWYFCEAGLIFSGVVSGHRTLRTFTSPLSVSRIADMNATIAVTTAVWNIAANNAWRIPPLCFLRPVLYWVLCRCEMLWLCWLCGLCAAPTILHAQLSVTAPVLNERLAVGGSYTIRWTGINPQQTVSIDWSADLGATWLTVTTATFGGSFLWQPIPDMPVQNRALVRVTVLGGASAESPPFSIVDAPFLEGPTRADFGRLLCETTPVSRTWTVRNRGSAPLVLNFNQARFEGSHPTDFVLVPPPQTSGSATINLTVVHRPLGVGERSARLIIPTNAPNAPQYVVELLSRKDSTRLRLSQDVVEFAEAEVGLRQTFTITVFNEGTVPYTLNPANFTRAESGMSVFFPNGVLVPAGGSLEATVQIIPPAGLSFDRPIREFFSFTDSCNRTARLAVIASRRPAPAVLQTPSGVPFGNIVCESSRDISITLGNTGEQTFALTSATLRGIHAADFRILEPTAQSIERGEVNIRGGESLQMRLQFAPAITDSRFDGFKEAQLELRGVVRSVPSQRDTTVFIRLTGEKRSLNFRLSNDMLDFGTATLSAVDPRPLVTQIVQELQIINTGSEPLRFRNVGETQGNFQFESLTPNPIPAGGTGTVRLRFLGSSTAQEFRETFRFRDSCGTERAVVLTASVRQPAGRLEVEEQELNFGTLICQNAFDRTVTLRNTGGQPITITALRVEQVQPLALSRGTAFALLDAPPSPQMPLTLQAATNPVNARTIVRLRFAPRDTGDVVGRLVVVSNDATNPEMTLSLRGRKDSVSAVIEPDVLTLATTQASTPTAATFTLRNTGTRPIVWQEPTAPPRSLGANLTLHSIEPYFTPPGGVSLGTVRFAGAAEGFSTSATLTLSLNECERSVSVRVQASVSRQARIAASTTNITFGRILCESSSQATFTLENTGSENLVLRSLRLEGAGAAAFVVQRVPTTMPPTAPSSAPLAVTLPFTLGVRERETLLITFLPRSPGLTTATLVVESNAVNAPRLEIRLQAHKDSIGGQILASRFDLGVTGAATPLERTVELMQNVGTTPLVWTNLPYRFGQPLGQFSIEEVTPNPTPVGARAQARVRFAGGTGGMYETPVTISDTCGRLYRTSFTALVVGGAVALQPFIGLQPSREVDVPVLLNNRAGIRAGMRLQARVRLGNFTMATFVGVVGQSGRADSTAIGVQRIEGSERVAVVSASVNSDNSQAPVAVLRLRGLLGNDSVTTLTVDNVVVGGFALSGSAQSRVEATGFNQAGGTRLYHLRRVRLVSLAPNPATAEVQLTLLAQASTPFVLKLVDVFGRRTVLHEGSVAAGEHRLTIPLGAVASGVYVLELHTPEGAETLRLSVVK